jgi:lipopolysaccharide transport system permease protein
MLMYASPSMYELSWAQEGLAKYPVLMQAYMLNPLASVIEIFRWSLLGQGQTPWNYFAYAAGLSVLLFIAGAFQFKKMERRFADVI